MKWKLIGKIANTLTKAPMTPKLVSLRYSKGLDLLVVLRKGYKYRGMWAATGKRQLKKTHLGYRQQCEKEQIPLTSIRHMIR